MATISICDECGERLGRFALRIEPTTGEADGDVMFLDGSWNGGVYCTVACARTALGKLRDPVTSAEPPDGFTSAG